MIIIILKMIKIVLKIIKRQNLSMIKNIRLSLNWQSIFENNLLQYLQIKYTLMVFF